MVDSLYDLLTHYYGLDWLGLVCGVSGMYLVTCKKRFGFFFSAIAGLCGFAVASMGGQYGYVVYNAILFCLMVKGFRDWGPQKPIPDKISMLKQPELS